MWVVKLGGSLAFDPALKVWLRVLTEIGGGRVVIVPGGGPFADTVREEQNRLGFDDATAHRMALHAMTQYGLMLAALAPGLTTAASEDVMHDVLRDGGVPVWLPVAMTIDNPDIPESWDITSDSLAAWLARRLDADILLLVKCCAVPDSSATPFDLQRRGIVDAAFPEFMRGARFPVLALHKDQHTAFQAMLAASRGTV
jgi:5-(aminomethyl)-3-furanmethanol phosphate kinase